jgi:methionine aminopeptidase
MIMVKTEDKIVKMHSPCMMALRILNTMVEYADVGVSTYDLDYFGRDLMMELGARSVCVHYPRCESP